MPQKIIATSILACLVLLAGSRVEAKETVLPPFCVATPTCGPETGFTPDPKATGKSADPAPKGNVQGPGDVPAACTPSCDMGNKARGCCRYLAANLQWACCSREPYDVREKK